MQHPAVCPHLHLPLQSGDADVLARMNRRYTPEEFLAIVERARERLDRPAITTDVMVGFPGETDEQFAHTLDFCRRAQLRRTHVFPFSPRAGTPAAQMPGRVPAKVVSERSARLRELARQMAAEWAQSFVGQTVPVLFDRCTASGRLHGYTDRYVPLTAAGSPDEVGHVLAVQATVQVRRRPGGPHHGALTTAKRAPPLSARAGRRAGRPGTGPGRTRKPTTKPTRSVINRCGGCLKMASSGTACTRDCAPAASPDRKRRKRRPDNAGDPPLQLPCVERAAVVQPCQHAQVALLTCAAQVPSAADGDGGLAAPAEGHQRAIRHGGRVEGAFAPRPEPRSE